MLVLKKAKDINLLPESEAAQGVTKAAPILLLFLVVLVGVVVVSLIVTFLKFSTASEGRSLQEDLAVKNQEWQKVASSAAGLSQIKNKLTSYQSFKTQYPSLNPYIEKLKSQLPSSASLMSLSIDNKGKANFQVEMSKPEDGYQLVEILNKNTNFSGVRLVTLSKSGQDGKYLINIDLTISK